jgi:hypothetical protein
MDNSPLDDFPKLHFWGISELPVASAASVSLPDDNLNGNFRILKWRYHILLGYSLKFRPYYIGLIYGIGTSNLGSCNAMAAMAMFQAPEVKTSAWQAMIQARACDWKMATILG